MKTLSQFHCKFSTFVAKTWFQHFDKHLATKLYMAEIVIEEQLVQFVLLCHHSQLVGIFFVLHTSLINEV